MVLFQFGRRSIRYMYDGDMHHGGDLRGYLVHGIGADQEKLRSGSLQPLCGSAQDIAAPFPVAAGLALLDFAKLHAMENNFCGMEPAKPVFHFLVDSSVIGDRALPTHSANQANRFHPNTSIVRFVISSYHRHSI